MPIHPSYPLSGRDAFRTATGVHAAAIIKAEKKGDRELADRIYSGVPAGMFGRQQEIEIGHYSGRSNVVYWLRAHGYEPSDELVDKVFNFAKQQDHTLTTDEVEGRDGQLIGEAAAEGRSVIWTCLPLFISYAISLHGPSGPEDDVGRPSGLKLPG